MHKQKYRVAARRNGRRGIARKMLCRRRSQHREAPLCNRLRQKLDLKYRSSNRKPAWPPLEKTKAVQTCGVLFGMRSRSKRRRSPIQNRRSAGGTPYPNGCPSPAAAPYLDTNALFCRLKAFGCAGRFKGRLSAEGADDDSSISYAVISVFFCFSKPAPECLSEQAWHPAHQNRIRAAAPPA